LKNYCSPEELKITSWSTNLWKTFIIIPFRLKTEASLSILLTKSICVTAHDSDHMVKTVVLVIELLASLPLLVLDKHERKSHVITGGDPLGVLGS